MKTIKNTIVAAVVIAAALLSCDRASAQFIHIVNSPEGGRTVSVSGIDAAGDPHLRGLDGVYSADPVFAIDDDLYYVTDPGEMLTTLKAQALLSAEEYESYRKGRDLAEFGFALEKVGLITFLAGGAVGLLGGYTAMAFAPETNFKPLATTTLCLIGAGTICMALSMPFTVIGRFKVNRVADSYNARIRTGDVALAAVPGGMGLALRF